MRGMRLLRVLAVAVTLTTGWQFAQRTFTQCGSRLCGFRIAGNWRNLLSQAARNDKAAGKRPTAADSAPPPRGTAFGPHLGSAYFSGGDTGSHLPTSERS